MHTFSFEKLVVWQDSRILTRDIYKVTENFPSEERFGLTSQLRRASISIASNIAEGTSRKTKKDKAYFTTISFSSLMEVLNQIIIAQDLGYIERENYHDLRKQIEKIGNKLNALRRSQLL